MSTVRAVSTAGTSTLRGPALWMLLGIGIGLNPGCDGLPRHRTTAMMPGDPVGLAEGPAFAPVATPLAFHPELTTRIAETWDATRSAEMAKLPPLPNHLPTVRRAPQTRPQPTPAPSSDTVLIATRTSVASSTIRPVRDAFLSPALHVAPGDPPLRKASATSPGHLDAGGTVTVMPFELPEFASAPTIPPPPPSWDERWRDALKTLQALVRDRTGSPDPDGPWQVPDRVLDWLARAVVDEGPSGDVRPLAETLRDLEPMSVVELRFCRAIQGYGQFEPVAEAVFQAGQEVFLYCEVAGLRSDRRDEHHRTWLESTVEILRASDDEPLHREVLGQAEDLCRKSRQDYYVNYLYTLPADLPPGPYRLRLIQTDLIARTSASRDMPFQVETPALPAAVAEVAPETTGHH